MGNEQTQGSGRKTDVPYTAYSVSKKDPNNPEIITLNKKKEELGKAVSPHMRTLENLPRKLPLLADSIRSNFKYSTEETKTTNPNLAFLNSKPLIDGLAAFQTNTMRKSCVLLNTQKIVFEQIEDCKKTTFQTQKAVYKKYQEFKALENSLKDIEYIKVCTLQANKSIDLITQQLELLSSLIPYDVKKELKEKSENKT